jgi:hypothetical protein
MEEGVANDLGLHKVNPVLNKSYYEINIQSFLNNNY